MAYLGHIMKDGMLTPFAATCFSLPHIHLLPRALGLEAFSISAWELGCVALSLRFLAV